jgi:hypothetical protein
MPPVIRRIFKWVGMVLGVVLVGVLVLVGFLVLDSGGSKDQTIRQAVSPDGKLVAGIHQIMTPMHGGPDTLRVTIGSSERLGEVVYSQTYECSDYGAFRLQWNTPNKLTIVYGTCDSGRWHTVDENKVWQRDTEWRDVKIAYQDSGYVAHAKD